MKITGRNIKRRLYSLCTLPSNMKRARYFRGHGVHSPYIYAIVREVFMRSTLMTDDHSLYDLLITAGVTRRRAVQLQNLMTHCKYTSYKIDCPADQIVDCDIVFATTNTATEKLTSMAEKACKEHITLCIISPSMERQRDNTCKTIVDAHPCTSVDNRGYLLLFNNHLPRQRFRL